MSLLNQFFKIELTALMTTFLSVIHTKTQRINTNYTYCDSMNFYELSPALPLKDRHIKVVRPPRV